jgi:RimJ/RimL family protein N-acetyltransferase
MRVECGHDEEVAQWVHRQIPHMPTGFEDMAALSVWHEGEIRGAVIYHEYRGNDIQMSCAATSKKWLTKSVLRALFYYPFLQLKCDRVTAFVPKNNSGTRKFLESVGFKEEGNMRRGFITDDCIVYGMLKDECKWIKEA